jgi:hypothetical protein
MQAAAVAIWLWLIGAQPTAQLSGQVRDPSGAVVAGAIVTVIHTDSGLLRNAVTGEDGWYALSSLPEGDYKVTTRRTGFRTVARLGVHLGPDDAARLDFDLQIGGMQEFITIDGAVRTINTEDAASGIRLDGDAGIAEDAVRFPVNGQALQGFISLAPGVLATPATFGEAGQFSVNGQRPNANYFVTDGVSSNSGVGATGLPGQFSGGTLPAMTAIGSLDGMAVAGEIREVQVTTSTFSPEFGRMPGAQVLVHTSGGSNHFHAELSHSFRHEGTAAQDYFARRAGLARAPLRLNDFQATIGGPVQRDRTFFFGAIEVLRLRQPAAWRAPAPSIAAREEADPVAAALLDVFPRPQREASQLYGESTLQTSWPGAVTAGSFRIDRSLRATGAFFARYHETDSENRVGLVEENHSSLGTRSVTVGVTHSPGADMVNDLRLNFSHASVRSTWTPGLAGEEALAAVRSLFPATFEALPGRLYGFAVAGLGRVVWSQPSTSGQGQFQVVDTLAISAGRHQVRLGFDYLRLTPSRREPISTAVAQYPGLDGLIEGGPPAIAFGGAPGGASLIEIASAFAQDTWSLGRRLNLTYGVRWEYMPPPASRVLPAALLTVPSRPDPVTPATVPSFQALPEWNARLGRVAPRVGLAFRLNQSGNWVVRAGSGTFYDLGFASAIDPLNAIPFNSWVGLARRRGETRPAVSLQGFASDLRIPYSWQWNLTVEGAAPGVGVVSAAWVGSRGIDLLRREGYIASPALILATSHGRSDYDAFQLHLRRRFAQGLGVLASYMWSHSIDNGSWDSGSYLVTSSGSDANRGPSNFDVRHLFSLGFDYDLPALARGWSLHGIARMRTGFPIDLLVQENVFGSGFDNAPKPDLVNGAPVWLEDPNTPGGRRLNPDAFVPPAEGVTGNLGRNAIRGSGMAQLDAAVERKFRLAGSDVRFRLQAYNVSNTPSLGDPVRVLTNPLFGQPVSMTNLMLGSGRPISGLAPAFQPGGPRTLEASVHWSFGRE